jgi:predicted MPP superfamily phosphohydrolase
MSNSGFILLENKITPLYYKDTTPIIITGYNPMITKPNYTIITDFIDNKDTSNLFKLVLTHEPNSLDKFIDYNPNLVLSGHSLGGIIDLKFTTPLALPQNSTKYYDDYQKIKNTDLYISNGLGSNGLNARFLNPPSINLYRFYKTK